MTPERKEEIKRDAQSGKGYEDAFILNLEVLELLTALEETQQRNVSLNEESLANFREAAKRGKLLAEAQQTIARLTAALIAERDAALVWDGIGTIRRINEALGEGAKTDV